MGKGITKPAIIAVGALVLTGGAFAARYIASEGADSPGAMGRPSASHASAAMPTTRVSTSTSNTYRGVPPGGELAPQAGPLTPSPTQVQRTYATWLTPQDLRPVGDPRDCALIDEGTPAYAGLIYKADGPCTTYIARVPLPEGVRLAGYTLLGIDNDPAAEMTIGMQRPVWRTDGVTSTIVAGDVTEIYQSGLSQASTAIQFVARDGSQPFPTVTIDHEINDGNTIDRGYVNLVVTLPSPNLGVYAIVVNWNRQYGPKSSTQVFSDVPLQHAYATEIEMLSKAAISNGCGSGRFCPDAPVTRGQMAVFLSRSLGLYDETNDN